jgi:ABC-type multidrug transport system fused ATPase/permease subunit
MADTTDERVKGRISILNQTLSRIEKESKHYDSDARLQGIFHRTFTAVLAVLAVAAPALVTYQTQSKNAQTAIVVVLVTAIAGAGTALQGVFRWGDRFRRTRLTALELKELLTATELDKEDIEDSTDDLRKFAEIRELNDRAATRLQAIIRNHIESEVALVSQQTPPTPPKDPPGSQPPGGVLQGPNGSSSDKPIGGRVRSLHGSP